MKKKSWFSYKVIYKQNNKVTFKSGFPEINEALEFIKTLTGCSLILITDSFGALHKAIHN